MARLHLDAPTGVAGDMLLGALADLGVPEAVLNGPLQALGLSGHCRIICREDSNGGLRGMRARVEVLATQQPHRHWRTLRAMVQAAPLQAEVQRRTLRCFALLAEAEAAVHGCDVDAVHFHEVGALDSLADVTGCCAGLVHLGTASLACSVLPAGRGKVSTAHGLLPLPVPAVLELAHRHGVPLAGGEGLPAGELVTPTGLALLLAWDARFGAMATLRPLAVGVGLGTRELEGQANLLRLILASTPSTPDSRPLSDPAMAAAAPLQDQVLLLQCQLDDMDGEALGALQQLLLEAGALDVWIEPIQMKKQRPGQLLALLVAPGQGPHLRELLWHNSTTLGIRERLETRWLLPRRQQSLETPWGPVPIKVATLPDGSLRCKAEHDALLGIARREDLPLHAVRSVVARLMDVL